MAAKRATAGRKAPGRFAPKPGERGDDALFGDVWSREDRLSPHDRSIVTVTALITSGIFDSSLRFHLTKAKENGVAAEEIAEVLTQLAFYSGWPKAWAAFRLAREIWTGGSTAGEIAPASMFPLGSPNDACARWCSGKSWLCPLEAQDLSAANVTFEPGCRSWWHIHHGAGQTLLVTAGRGWYCEAGAEPRGLRPGDSVKIPPEVKHWHGAAGDSWFSHIALGVPLPGSSCEWVAPVTDAEYSGLK